MSRIVSKLNLNKTPQLVESNSLIFAKNIKLLKDGSIGQDDSILPVEFDDNVLRRDINNLINECNNNINNWQEEIERLKASDTQADIKQCYKNYILQHKFIEADFIYSSWLYSGGAASNNPTFLLTSNTNLSNYIEHENNNISVNVALARFNNLNGTSHTELKFPLFPKKLFAYIKGIINNGPGKSWFDNFDYATYCDTLYELKDEDSQFIQDNFEEFPFVDDADPLFTNETYKVEYDGGLTNLYFCSPLYAWMISYFLIHHSKQINAIIKEAKENSRGDYNFIYSRISLLNTYIKKEQDKIKSYEYYLEAIDDLANYDIVGVIPYNTEYYLFLYKAPTDNSLGDSIICKYKEDVGFSICSTNWNYSGGIIDGKCYVNLNGDTLITICEYKEDNTLLVPIKTINLNTSNKLDDESFYTQIPKINFINLSLIEYYNKVISSGVYQFFIRYKISDNFYTNWFPASRELFAGTRKFTHTPQGPLQYIDTSIDSSKSFHFLVDKIAFDDGLQYEAFQIGFILSHDDQVYAKSWKEFPLDTTDIYFDFNTEYLDDIEVSDLLESSYGLFNVKNVTTFKNKLYVSNYIETNFNPELSEFIDIDIDIEELLSTSIENYYYNYLIDIITVDDINYIRTIDDKSIADIVRYNLNSLRNYLIFDTSVLNKSVNHKGVKLYVEREEGLGFEHPYKYSLFVGPSGAAVEYTSDNLDELLDMIVSEYNIVSTAGNFYSTSNVLSQDVVLFSYRGTKHTIYRFTFSISTDNIVIAESPDISNLCTLMPGQEYDFYVHFVKDTGEYTNGYKIGTKLIEIDSNSIDNIINNHPVFYPTFTFNNELPKGYVGCFISMHHSKNIISEIFNIHQYDSKYIGDNLDIDTRQYTDINGLDVINTAGSNLTGTYHASYDNSIFKYFGASGKVELNATYNKTNAFILIPHESNSEYIQLTRITPYIVYTSSGYVYDRYEDLNLQSFVCTVYKPYDNFDYYIAGTDVYKKAADFSDGSNLLSEIDDQTVWSNFATINISGVHSYKIYSNFNLNYLSLVNDTGVVDLVPRIVSKTFDNGGGNISDRRLLILTDSINLSEIYELKSMYKQYTRKTYNPYNDNNIIKFDNTVRSSTLNGDESKINIFKFRATDYYNIPTDKGIIINLVAIGDSILAHTQDSMYKFIGNNSLSAAGGEEVAMKEGEPFDTGIQEIFGSEFGFAGLKYKHQHTITENGYTFFDWDSKTIYLYTGQGQVTPISDAIEKLLNRNVLLDVLFANDFYNDRIFILLQYEDAFVTLSFNFRIKAFISLHDFVFTNSFHTKTRCYFYNQNNIHVISKHSFRTYSQLSDNDNLYPYLDTFHFNPSGIVYDPSDKCSIVDVILNDDYENVKTLNWIDWICNKIIGFNSKDNIKSVLVAEENLSPYAGGFIRIYSDSTCTDLMPMYDRSNDYALANYSDSNQLKEEQRNIYPTIPRNRVNINSYKYPRYNLGKWTLNYFRNILNIHDPSDATGSHDTPSASDNKSLIYGKYIVVRFVFSSYDNFKLEDIGFNIAQY